MTHDPKPLSLRHARFVAEYLRDGNATRAYIRAGYSAGGAQSCAPRLLAQPHIADALAVSHQRIAPSLTITIEYVAQGYARIAFAPVEVDGNHGKPLQARRLKLQAPAAPTRQRRRRRSHNHCKPWQGASRPGRPRRKPKSYAMRRERRPTQRQKAV